MAEEMSAVISVGFKSSHRIKECQYRMVVQSSHVPLPLGKIKVFSLIKYYILKVPGGRGAVQKAQHKPKYHFFLST